MDNSDFTQATFTSTLDYDVLIYDSFNPSNPTDAENNYLGELTTLGTLKANSTTSILPIRVLSTFVLEKADTTEPLKRAILSQMDEKLADFSISLDPSDESIMTLTLKFIDFFLANPNDPLVVAFNAILSSGSKTLATDVDGFFASHPDYAGCTYMTYMMGLVYRAQHPAPPPPAPPDPSQPSPAPERSYSLSTLVRLLGGEWPQGLEDITVKDLNIAMEDTGLKITLELDFTTLTFENDEVAGNVAKLVTDTTIKASLFVNFKLGLNILGTRILLQFDDFSIPVSDTDKIQVTKPSASIDINPLFKFVVFTLSGAIPATIFSTPIDVDISLTVDNDEAAIGCVVEGSNTSLPAPPGVKGLHFDSIGVGMGVFFKPPGFAFGVEGKFHIGDSTTHVITLDDDTFAIVCEYVGEVIKPKYLGFYVPKLDLNTIIELFTNASPNLDVPVEFSDLSFHWSDSLMDVVVLPDGTLSPGGYGFSATAQVFSFGFYGQANIDINTGLTANVEVSPINWKNIFKLEGDGKGFSIKVDKNGNPIPINFVPVTQEEIDAVASATDKPLVSPGGANLIINTLSLPILHLNAKASLFDLLDCNIAADINKDGIKFELDYGAILTEKMVCNLSDFHNLYGEFGYYIDKSIQLPTIAGINPGSIPLKADASLHLSIATSTTDVVISTGGNFDFEGYHFSFGDFNADININKIADFVEAIVQYIIDNAKTVFNQIIDTAEHWAAAAAKGIVTGFDDVGKVMKNVFNKTEQDMATILKDAGFAADVIAEGLKNGYNAASQDVAAILKAVGYDATVIGNAIKNTWNCGIDDVSWALQQVGYGADDVANALKAAFNATAQAVANTLKKWGYALDDVAKMIKDVFKGDSIAVAAIMKAAGYAIDDISKAIKDAWNCGINDVTYALKEVGYTADEIAVSLKNVFNAASQDVAAALKAMGFAADEVATAIKNCWNCGINDVTWAMTYVGYAAQDIASGLKSAFNAAAQDVANAFNAIGIAAENTANAIKTVYNLTIDDAASVLKQAGYAASDVASALQNAFNTSVEAVASAMKAVGYAGDEVKSAFDSLGGDFENFADSAWKKLSDPNTWNPANW